MVIQLSESGSPVQRHFADAGLRPAIQARGHRTFHIAQTDGADVTLRLRDDMGGLQPLQLLVENVVDRQCVAESILNGAINLAAVGVNVNGRLGTGG